MSKSRERLIPAALLIIVLSAWFGPFAWAQSGAYTSPALGGISSSSPVPPAYAQGPTFNVKNYGAVGDAQFVNDGVTAGGGSKTVTSATAAFKSSDVGKKIACVATGPTTLMNNGIILSVTATVATTDTTDSGAGVAERCVWYTKDDTAAFQAANTAALPAISTTVDPNFGRNIGANPGSVYCPEGGYAVSGRIFNFPGGGSSIGPNFIGAGRNKCIIYILPSLIDPNDGFGVLMNWSSGYGGQFRGFTVEGLGFGTGATIAHALINMYAVQQLIMEDVAVTEATGGGNKGTVSFENSGSGLVSNLYVQGGNTGQSDYACGFIGSNAIVVRNIFCSNHNRNLIISSSGGHSVFGAQGPVFEGGSIDECGSTTLDCTALIGATPNFFGTVFMVGNSGRSAINIDATSIGYFTDISCGQYGSTTVVSNCMLGASGGTAYVTGSNLRGNGAGGLSVSGPAGFNYFDLGGNVYQNCVSAVCSTATFAQAFGGGVFPVFPLPLNAVTQLGGRQTVSGTAPTFAVTGFGTGPTVTVGIGSTDAAGSVLITAGTTPGSSGTLTLTFSTVTGAYGTNPPACIFGLQNGTGSWNALAQEPIVQTPTTTSVIANWADNSIALTAASTYGFVWTCYGK